jgi:hypothetical protein
MRFQRRNRCGRQSAEHHHEGRSKAAPPLSGGYPRTSMTQWSVHPYPDLNCMGTSVTHDHRMTVGAGIFT